MMIKLVVLAALLVIQQSSALIQSTNGDQSSDPVPPQECTTDDGQPGFCVPIYLCDKNSTIIRNAQTSMTVKFGECENFLHLCCKLPKDPDSSEPSETVTPPQRPGCGWRNPNGIGAKRNAASEDEAHYAEFPWMVAILELENPDNVKSVSGGSLIHPSVVLTAAHKVFKDRSYKVRAGERDMSSTTEMHPTQEKTVNEIVIHENFNKGALYNDIAMLFLSEPMDLSQPNVGVVCLPTPTEQMPHGTRCLASVWGNITQDSSQNILKKMELPVIDEKHCLKGLRKTRAGYFFILDKSFMCAGGEKGIDTCEGDGGSPLVCPIQNIQDRYVQSGIVSWGIDCKTGSPGVYADVGKKRTWIDNKMAEHGFDAVSYTYI